MRRLSSLLVLIAALAAVFAALVFLNPPPQPDATFVVREADSAGPGPQRARRADGPEPVTVARERAEGEGSVQVQRAFPGTARVSGVVLDARNGMSRAGVAVRALRRPPGVERLFSRMRGLFDSGLWTDTSRAPELLGEAVTGADGRFQIDGLPDGLVFLDAVDEFGFTQTAPRVRLAPGAVREGVEIRLHLGGRLEGRVVGPEGPIAEARIDLRPGLSAFLGQLSEKRYSWREVVTAEDGSFVVTGVPPGVGYEITASSPAISLTSSRNIEIREQATTRVDLEAGFGGTILGRVVNLDGEPVAGAEIAMVYLDVSRVLFSANGREDPIRTDAEGRFAIPHVAPGRVALVADAPGLAASGIDERAVVEGGRYEDVELVLGTARKLRGRVVDELGRGIAGATVDALPIERPTDPDVVKLALRLRKQETRADADGAFELRGLGAGRLLVRAEAEGYVGEGKFGVRIDELDEPLELCLQRCSVVVGRVVDATDGAAVTRFRVRVRQGRRAREASSEKTRDEYPLVEGGEQRGPRAFQRGRGRVRLVAGRDPSEALQSGGWREVSSTDGSFDFDGAPGGSLRVDVQADGYVQKRVSVSVAPGARSEELLFELEPGLAVSGIVVDASTQSPMADVSVVAYRDGERRRPGIGPFRVGFDREDVDFLGIANVLSGDRRQAETGGDGGFQIDGLAPGTWRLTARSPGRPKESVQEIELPRPVGLGPVTIQIGSGGAVEGYITASNGQPLPDALVVATNLSSGTLRSAPADSQGFYRIEGLAQGNYIVVRSRLDGDTTNIGYAFLGNLRLKNVRVREGETTRFDLQDDEAGTARIVGTVRDDRGPVSRALVTALGSDSDGIFGLGIRAQPTDDQGRFEMPAMKPGSYVFQVSRFAQRPEQANLEVNVPVDTPVVRVDLDLPSSVVRGRVVGPDGEGIGGVRVAVGVLEGGPSEAPGLLGLVLRNGLAQARTRGDGSFELRALAAGTYRVSARQRSRRRRASQEPRFGEATVQPVVVDGVNSIDDVVIRLPLAAAVSGRVVDGSGVAVAGAEVTFDRRDAERVPEASGLQDLLGVSVRPTRTDSDGSFELAGLSPGTYTLRADIDGLSPGVIHGLVVVEGGRLDGIELQVVRGATVRVRCRNVDGSQVGVGQITILDGAGKPVRSPVSVASVFRTLMRGRERVDDSGWYEVGNVRPDTYTLVVQRPGEPDYRVVRTIADGDNVSWDIDLADAMDDGR